MGRYTPKTKEQVRSEMEALRELKPRVRRQSAFGEDNHAKIEAQIEVLRDNLDEDAIYERFQDADDPDEMSPELDAALDARRWMDGENPEGLAEGWEPLASA